MDKEKTRIQWIDYARGFGIFLVLIGHTYHGNWLVSWVYSFHMPLFFFLSGLTLHIENRSEKEFIKSRIRSLIIPHICYSFMYILLNVFKVYTNDIELKNLLMDLLVIRNLEKSCVLWFLPLLFFAEIITTMVLRCIHNRKVQTLFFCVIMICGFCYAYHIGKPLPWGIDAALIASGFLYAGYRFQNKLKRNWSQNRIPHSINELFLFAGLLLGNIIFGYMNQSHLDNVTDMFSLRYGNVPLYLISAFTGIGCVVILCSSFIKKNHPFWGFVGKNTLHIYCIHGLVLVVIRKLLKLYVTHSDNSWKVMIINIVLATFTLFGCCIIIKCVEIISKELKNLFIKRSKGK